MDKRIERIEAELSAKWLTKFLVDVSQLTETSFLEKLFTAAVANTFKFRKVDSYNHDKNRNKKTEIVSIINFDKLNSQPLYCKPVYNNISDKEMSKRQTAKTTLHLYIRTGSTEAKEFLQHLTVSIAAPKRTNWPNLLTKYANEYEGRIADETEKRINEFR
jgi:hypothetical protein